VAAGGPRRKRRSRRVTERYARQSVLAEVGAVGQARLAAARVLVVGAGGLGCAVLAYLAAAGVGRLVIVDHDRVEESNLHRQPLYRMSDLGQGKAQAARAALLALNPTLHIETRAERLSAANAAALVAAADVAVDAADSFAVTYVLSDACQQAQVAAAPLRDVMEVLADPHLHARGFFTSVPAPGGPVLLPNSPVRYDGSPLRALAPAPALGEHTDQVLAELCGLDETALKELRRDGVLGA